MGCNCGKKPKPLNNLNSKDHLKLASDTFKNIIEIKPMEEYTDLDVMEILSVYKSLYPNQKMKPTLEVAIEQLREAHNRYKS